MKIIKGSIKINQCHCLTSEDNKSYNIIALQSQSLPIISHYTTPEMEEDGVPSVSIINWRIHLVVLKIFLKLNQRLKLDFWTT